jgi:Spy/CpxP family protein refolding chaperone
MNRKSMIISAVLMLVAIAVLGQVILAAGQHAGACGKGRLLQSKNLTDAQKAQVKSIFQDAKTKVQAVRNDKSLTPDQQKAQIRDIFTAAKEQVKQILTPEQQQKLAQERKEMRGRGIRRVLAALNLTDAQKTQVKALAEAQREEMQGLKEQARKADEALRQLVFADAPDQGAIASAKAEVSTAQQALLDARTANELKISQVLTPAQRAELRKMQGRMGGGRGRGPGRGGMGMGMHVGM